MGIFGDFNFEGASTAPASVADLGLNFGGNTPSPAGILNPGYTPRIGDISSGNNAGSTSWDTLSGWFGGGDSAAGGGGSSLFGDGGIAGGIGSLLGGAGGIAQAVMAGKQAKLGADMFDWQKSTYNENNRLQAQTLNRQLEDRQLARIASQGLDTYTARRGDPSQYLEENKITPRKV